MLVFPELSLFHRRTQYVIWMYIWCMNIGSGALQTVKTEVSPRSTLYYYVYLYKYNYVCKYLYLQIADEKVAPQSPRPLMMIYNPICGVGVLGLTKVSNPSLS